VTATNTIAPHAFAVWWKDFDYWQVRALWLALTNKCRWPTVRLGDIATVRSEVVPDDDIHDGKVSMLDRISFDEGRVFFGKRTTTRMVQFRARPGDIVVSKINARKRAIGIVQDGANVGVTIHFRALIPDTVKVDAEFLWAALRSTYCSQQFEVETGGIGKGEISEERLLAIAVPLPPMATQKAIIAHWRKAQDDIAAARERVKKRKVVIDARFFADLGLRSPAQGSMPKAFAVWWQDFLRWGAGFNYLYQSGADLTRGKYPVVDLGSLLELVQYGTSEKANTNNDGVAVIRMNNILDGELDLGNLKHLRLSKNEMGKLLLKDGDILFNRTNSKELVGKCAVFHAQGEYVFASYLIRIRADSSKANPDFLAYVVNSPIGRQQINALSRQIIGQANINSIELRSLQIPLPPLSVQKQIMERVAAGREEIAREREAADRLAHDINAEIEALILGTKKVSEL
jgi:restriction endonuclease S subunit